MRSLDIIRANIRSLCALLSTVITLGAIFVNVAQGRG